MAEEENIELLTQGKVVILLDKENLIYDIAVPERDATYYVHYNDVKSYFYENKVPDVVVSDTINGILFSVNLNFIPDSPELLPSEQPRIKAIAENLATGSGLAHAGAMGKASAAAKEQQRSMAALAEFASKMNANDIQRVGLEDALTRASSIMSPFWSRPLKVY